MPLKGNTSGNGQIDKIFMSYSDPALWLYMNITIIVKSKLSVYKTIGPLVFSSPEPLGSQGELIGWP